MKFFSRKINKAITRARNDERLKCEREFIHQKKIELQKLENEKNLEIAEIRAEMESMEIHTKFWKEEYEKMLKRNQGVKIQEKRNAKLANDLYFLINEKVKSDSEIISNIGTILSDAGIKLIER